MAVGKWKLVYYEHIYGTGIVQSTVELRACKEKAAITEAKEVWKKMPKRSVDLSHLGFSGRIVVFPHSPQLLCLLDSIVDPDDGAGKPAE